MSDWHCQYPQNTWLRSRNLYSRPVKVPVGNNFNRSNRLYIEFKNEQRGLFLKENEKFWIKIPHQINRKKFSVSFFFEWTLFLENAHLYTVPQNLILLSSFILTDTTVFVITPNRCKCFCVIFRPFSICLRNKSYTDWAQYKISTEYGISFTVYLALSSV